MKDNTAELQFYRSGLLYYDIETKDGRLYQFTVDVDDKVDIGSASFERTHKAINLMRYVRKSIENETFIKLK